MMLIARLVYKKAPHVVTRNYSRGVSITTTNSTDEILYVPDDEPFPHLVNTKYDEKYLLEWEPAPVIPHKDDEPGHLGSYL